VSCHVALAIQVITARKMETPALIFDEVDVGISGQPRRSSANFCVN
jgi:DNA repair ATPase RecN